MNAKIQATYQIRITEEFIEKSSETGKCYKRMPELLAAIDEYYVEGLIILKIFLPTIIYG